MDIQNTEEEYGALAKFFHWTIAVLILGLLPVGLGMGAMENSPLKLQVFAMHKSFGLLVFFLGLGRIVWRFVSPPPDHLETHAHWEVTLAGAAHFWLYVCIIGMPLSGWLMSNAGEFPVPFFGLQMPALIGKDEDLGHFFREAHEILGFTLLFVLALHIAGALKHHVIDKDITLQRMAFYRPGLLLPALVVLIAGLSYGLSAFGLLKEEDDGEGREYAVAASPLATAAVDTSTLGDHEWAIVPAQSKVQFQALVYKAPFTADFHDFSGTIVFDPDDLSTAKADITINMSDITSGDTDRDQNMKGAEWFDVAQFSESHFMSKRFEKGEGNNYVAIGDVTIHGITMPLIIPFTLDLTERKAHMMARFSLDRTHFAVGLGQWEDESAVAHNIDVVIDLIAVR